MDTMLTYNTNSKNGPVCGGRANLQHVAISFRGVGAYDIWSDLGISIPYKVYLGSTNKFV